MDWYEVLGAVVVALASAVIGVYVGAGRSLRAPHREHLYERQIDIYLRLIGSSTTVRDAGHRFLSELTSDDPNTDVGALLDNLGKVLGQDGSDLEAFLLLPSRVQEAATRLHSVVGTTYGIYRSGKHRVRVLITSNITPLTMRGLNSLILSATMLGPTD